MKKSFILKQIAVAMTESGEIGADHNLAFKGDRDLVEFAKFTDQTAMIVGLDTAQQMADKNVLPTDKRPWVVISRGRFINTIAEGFHKNVYYVSSLEGAIAIATDLAECNAPVIGYTIIGGARIYEDAFDLMRAGKLRLNSAYVHEGQAHDTDTTVLNKKLSLNFIDFMKLLDSNMITRKVTGFDCGVRVKNISDIEHRMAGKFRWVYDANEYDPSVVEAVSAANRKLYVTTMSDEVFALDLFNLMAYKVGTATEAIELHLNYGKVELRPKHKRAGINAVEIALRKNWI